jgi:hypothetical protein
MTMSLRRTAALVTLALAVGTLAACTPTPENFWLTNRTGHALSVRWGPDDLGTVEAGATSKIDIPWSVTCIDEPVRVVTEDGELAAVVDEGPICPESGIELNEENLAPATATAMVVNTTDADVDLSFVTGADLTAAPGEEVEVALEVPAGECVYLPASRYESWRFAEIPRFWGSALCDGQVKPLSLTGPATAVFDNRTSRDLTIFDGTRAVGTVAAQTRSTVDLSSTECVVDRLRVLDAGHAWTATLPKQVCPTDVLVVDALGRTASATLTNATDLVVGLTFTGAMLTTTDVRLEPHESRRMTLESPVGTYVLVDGEPDRDLPRFALWSGYLCDGATLTARIDVVPGRTDDLVWTASW